jgi:hypothetical protein
MSICICILSCTYKQNEEGQSLACFCTLRKEKAWHGNSRSWGAERRLLLLLLLLLQSESGYGGEHSKVRSL